MVEWRQGPKVNMTVDWDEQFTHAHTRTVIAHFAAARSSEALCGSPLVVSGLWLPVFPHINHESAQLHKQSFLRFHYIQKVYRSSSPPLTLVLFTSFSNLFLPLHRLWLKLKSPLRHTPCTFDFTITPSTSLFFPKQVSVLLFDIQLSPTGY